MPAKLISDFSLAWASATFGVALFVATLAASVFNLGLRRYSSGAVWTAA